MYKDEMRADFETALYENVEDLSSEELAQIMKAFDETSLNYEVFSDKVLNDISGIDDKHMPPIYHEYLECRESEGTAAGTIKVMKCVLRYFFLFIKDRKDLNDVKPNDIRCFLTSYKATHNISNRTLDLYRIDVCCFFKWASAEGYIDKNPAERIHKIKFIRNERDYLSDDQLEAFRDTAENSRDSAMIEFLYSTGCRVAEMCNTKIKDIDFDSGCVTVFGKGSKFRKTYLNAKALRAINKYLEERKGKDDGCEYLFCSDLRRHPIHGVNTVTVQRRFNYLSDKCFDEVGIKVTPHVMRHTMASHAIQNGMAPELIQQVLGHNSINTTMIYAKVLDTDVKTMHHKCVR